MIPRRETRRVHVGDVPVGGGSPVAVQSMTNTDTRDVAATLAQIEALACAGCEIVRVAIPSASALDPFGAICEGSSLPVVADIHFDHRLAIGAIERGAAKVRINPGNIGDDARVDAVIEAAGAAGVPIRIGVNAGSLAAQYADLDWPLSEKLVASTLAFVEHFESRGFTSLVLSAKASDVNATVTTYRMLADKTDHPLHLGVTEAGTTLSGTVKSAVGLGILLSEGVGDTMRVSLTADPVDEVRAAWEILGALDIRRNRPELVSCPTCGRCRVDLIRIAQEVSDRLASRPAHLKVAVMGCIVNGPGEARDADIGIAAGDGMGMIFVHGEPIARVPEDELVDALMREIDSLSR